MQDDDPADDDPDDEDDAEEADEDLAGQVAGLGPLLLAVPPEAAPAPGVGTRDDVAVVVGDVAAVGQEPPYALAHRLAHTRRPVDPAGGERERNTRVEYRDLVLENNIILFKKKK